MSRRVLVFAITAMLTQVSAGGARAGIDPFLGEIMTVAFTFCPKGYAELRGQLLPINQNQALFSLLGTTYGGDGQTNFALPLGKPVITLVQGAPMRQCIAIQGIFPPRL